MAKLIITEFVSLDGVMEDPGGAENFEHGGWTFKFNRGEDGDKFKQDETMNSDALLLGRVTYEGFAQAWPTMKNEFADKFNSMPKFVFSSTLENPTWNNTTVISGDLRTEVGKLKDQFEKDIAVHGSGQLAQSLLKEGLADELRLMVFPTVLGSGKKLLPDGLHIPKLKLLETRTLGPDGIVLLTYQPEK